jgi:hypothetical protein
MVHVVTDLASTRGNSAADQVQVALRVRTDAVEMAITNGGDAPVDILWDQAMLVDTQGNASSVVLGCCGAERWTVPDTPGDVSRLAPHDRFHVFMIPARNVMFDPESAGWYADPLLPVECGPIRCVGYHELVDKSVRLTLPMRVNGTVQAYEWTLRIISAVKSVRGGRPQESPL